jgi:hypothetical protein
MIKINKMFWLTSLASIAISILVSGHLRAHDGGHDHDHSAMRQWTLSSGNTQFQGTFVSADNGNVTIHLRNGRVITLKADCLSRLDRQLVEATQAAVLNLNQPIGLIAKQSNGLQTADTQKHSDNAPAIAKPFQPFVDSKSIKTGWDDDYFFVESNGMPDHEMMVGITAWQQQIPIPQNYTGDNAWRIPLKPVPTKNPLSAKKNFFRGAIALAVNGVPIFNPIKNDGRTDTKLAGELDKFGGHCGRADDYHYHLPPVHLEKFVGKGKPIAFALDGYPILGFQTKDEAAKSKLDWLNGHKDDQGNYHYHSTKSYPYLNGGFYGKVVQRGGQVDPQPRGQGVRPAARPLRGAKITGFSKSDDGKSVSVEYTVRNEKRSASYTTKDFKTYVFTHDNGKQGKSTQTYQAKPKRRGGRRPR